MGKFFTLAAATGCCALGAHSAAADSLTLQSSQVGPAGTVQMTDTTLGGYSGDDFVAGILDWYDNTTSSNYYTYCIDLSSVITPGNTYGYGAAQSLNDAQSATGFSSDVDNAIEQLFSDTNGDEHDAAMLAAGSALSEPSGATANDEAAAFQIALWDIIENYGSGNMSQLSFANADPSDAIATGEAWAAAAWSDRNDPTTSNVDALIVSSGGQNQAIYITGIGNNGSPSTPLPKPVAPGLAMLALLAAKGWRRRPAPALV